MKSNKLWTTIIEAMIAMFIIVVWILWVYTIHTKSQKLSTTTENRLKAISIAREWIEVMQNIRDTNWILFWADPQNCWNVQDYNINCLWNNSYKIATWSYKTYKDIDNRWKIFSWTTVWLDYGTGTYRTDFEVKLDTNWLYTQSWWIIQFTPLFTRRIEISYPEDTNSDTFNNENDEKMLVKSIVSWADNSKKWFYTVTLENLLTNWK